MKDEESVLTISEISLFFKDQSAKLLVVRLEYLQRTKKIKHVHINLNDFVPDASP